MEKQTLDNPHKMRLRPLAKVTTFLDATYLAVNELRNSLVRKNIKRHSTVCLHVLNYSHRCSERGNHTNHSWHLVMLLVQVL